MYLRKAYVILMCAYIHIYYVVGVVNHENKLAKKTYRNQNEIQQKIKELCTRDGSKEKCGF